MKTSPETPNTIKNKYPATGSTSNLNIEAIRDNLKLSLMVLKVSAPPTESIARGRVTDDDNFSVLSINDGKPCHKLAYRIPLIQASISGLAINALAI